MQQHVACHDTAQMLSKGFEALALTLQEAAQAISHSDLRKQLQGAVQAKHSDSYPYLLDVFGDHTAGDVVFEMGGKYHRAPYSVAQSGKKVATTIGDHHEVVPRTSYHKVNSQEEAAVEAELDEFVALKESAVAQDGSTLLKLIAPGKGSSGFYSEGVLRTAATNRVFRAGTRNFWNHQTAAEEAARPEGNLDDLASVLTEDAYYAEGPKGPGLYAKAKVYEHYRKPIDEMAKDIGVSIRAQGKAREGQLPDGSKGTLIEELTRAISADYVTTPGAGGQVVSLFESKRNEAVRLREISIREENNDMDAAEVKRLIEADRASLTTVLTESLTTKFQEQLNPLQAENLRLRGRVQLTEAAGEVTKILAGLTLHQGVRDRVKARVLAGTLPVIEATGELDIPKLKLAVEADAKDEAEYLAKLLEGQGRVIGMGAADATTQAELTEAEYHKQMVESAMRDGYTKEQAEVIARGRAA